MDTKEHYLRPPTLMRQTQIMRATDRTSMVAQALCELGGPIRLSRRELSLALLVPCWCCTGKSLRWKSINAYNQGRRSIWDRGTRPPPRYLDWGDIITNVPL